MNWLDAAMANELSKRASAGVVEKHLRMLSGMMKAQGNKPPEGYAYANGYDYFLEKGHEYESAPLTEDELAVLKGSIKLAKMMYKPKVCYYNAQSLAQNVRGCRYVEGYMFAGMWPFEHAWNSINGKVVDFTMAHSNGGKPILGELPAEWEYFGTELSTSMVVSLWKRKGWSTPLVMNYEEDYPLFKNKPRRKTDSKPATGAPEDNAQAEASI